MESIIGLDLEMNIQVFTLQSEYFLKDYDPKTALYTQQQLAANAGLIGSKQETVAYYLQESYSLLKV